MLYTNIQPQSFLGSKEKNITVFIIMGMAAILVKRIWPLILNKRLIPNLWSPPDVWWKQAHFFQWRSNVCQRMENRQRVLTTAHPEWAKAHFQVRFYIHLVSTIILYGHGGRIFTLILTEGSTWSFVKTGLAISEKLFKDFMSLYM